MATERKVTLPNRYRDEYVHVAVHCPCCGQQNTWEGGGDDYYLGETFFCLDCNAKWYMPGGAGPATERYHLDLIELIKQQVAATKNPS